MLAGTGEDPMGVEALGEGLVDPAAFTALVDREGPAICAYLARRAPAEAEDLLGSVWLEAFAARRTFDPALGSARSWLFGVARHVLLRHWRDRRLAREQEHAHARLERDNALCLRWPARQLRHPVDTPRRDFLGQG